MPPDPTGAPSEASAERFEALYERLQQVTQRLESGELSLDDSVALYDEGMRLAARCQALLAEAEQRIEVLRQAFDSGFDAAGR
ncbi:MAG: exodeoxyribonuclease VII small subunit [Dehalococcoidia bacterium]|nr:exodeoxyribonuclease VII small subunit [Dehalococcoidia bacterium]